MRKTLLASAALALFMAGPALAQSGEGQDMLPALAQLGQAQDMLQRAAQGSDQPSQEMVSQAQDQATQAFERINKSLDQMPQGRQQQARKAVQEAEQALKDVKAEDQKSVQKASVTLADAHQKLQTLQQAQAGQAAGQPQGQQPQPSGQPQAGPTLTATQAEALIGKNAVTRTGEDVGEINDLIIGPGGQVQAAVVEVGGFLGIGARQVRIDWGNVSMAPDGERLIVDMTREQLESAPEYQDQAERGGAQRRNR